METDVIKIETALNHEALIERLKSMTVTDFSKFHNSPLAVYYGKIEAYAFDLKNVRFSPMSSAPTIEGEIVEGMNNTIVNIKIDIESHFKMVKGMYFKTLLPIGAIVLLLSMLVLGGTKYQIHGLIFSGLFIVCAFLYVGIVEMMLKRTKKKELAEFVARLEGNIL